MEAYTILIVALDLCKAKVIQMEPKAGDDQSYSSTKCSRCSDGHDPASCKCKKYKCHNCGKIGHLSIACRMKSSKPSSGTKLVSEDKSASLPPVLDHDDTTEPELSELGMYMANEYEFDNDAIVVDVDIAGIPWRWR